MTDKFRPAPGSQQERLLFALFEGKVVDPLTAIQELNISIVAARAAELRRLGWPVRKIDLPHPNIGKFPGEKLPAYFIDAHFRRWYAAPENKGKHPGEYPDTDGRGKFGEVFGKGKC